MPFIGAGIAVICAYVIINWWSEGMVEASEALVLVITFASVTMGMFAAHTPLQWLMAFIPFLGVVGYVCYSFRLGGLKAFYKKQCDDYIVTIHADPTNRAAREYLARTLYNMGELDRAIAEMEVAVQMGAELECQYTLSGWQKERYLRDCLNPICRRCYTENPEGARVCKRCGADLPYRSPLNHWLAGGRTASSRLYLILTAGAALVVASLLLLPLEYAFLPVGLLLLALGGWSLVRSSRS